MQTKTETLRTLARQLNLTGIGVTVEDWLMKTQQEKKQLS